MCVYVQSVCARVDLRVCVCISMFVRVLLYCSFASRHTDKHAIAAITGRRCCVGVCVGVFEGGSGDVCGCVCVCACVDVCACVCESACVCM
jgi:hypothetical protein